MNEYEIPEDEDSEEAQKALEEDGEEMKEIANFPNDDDEPMVVGGSFFHEPIDEIDHTDEDLEDDVEGQDIVHEDLP